jgi:hypothetical protein
VNKKRQKKIETKKVAEWTESESDYICYHFLEACSTSDLEWDLDSEWDFVCNFTKIRIRPLHNEPILWATQCNK